MKRKKGIVLLLCMGLFGLLPINPYAQSGRDDSGSNTKANHRPAHSPATSPTPIETEIIEPVAESDQTADDGEVIRVNTQLVSVPVRVMDKKGRFIGGLTKKDFRVFEDSSEQTIALFSNEHQPFTVALVLDMSHSSTFKIAEIQNAAIAFISQLRPQDKVIVISFDEDVHVLTEATSDRKEIYRAIKATKISNGTSLYDAVDLVMNSKLRSVEGRKAIILFTDGVDTTSSRSHDLANLRDAMELDSLIYTIRYDTFADVQKMSRGTALPPAPKQIPGQQPATFPFPLPLPPIAVASSEGTTAEEYRRAEEFLERLSTRTGGRIYQASTLTNLGEAYTKIASELREFYSIGYYPSQERTAGKQSKIKVKVDRPGVVVRSREDLIRPRVSK